MLVIAYSVGQRSPSSRRATSLKPSVAYRAPNFEAALKKHTTLPFSSTYAGMPYQVFGRRFGAASATRAWTRSARFRSSPDSAAIASTQAWASSAFFAPPRPEDRSSSARALIAAFSASLKPALTSVSIMTTSPPARWTLTSG